MPHAPGEPASAPVAPATTTPGARRWRFANAEFDEALGQLRVDGQPVPVEPRPLRLLAELLQQQGRVLSKEQLLARVWEGRPTVEHVLPSAINRLRKALGPQASACIVTLPRKGYRFVGQVKHSTAEPGWNAPIAPIALDATHASQAHLSPVPLARADSPSPQAADAPWCADSPAVGLVASTPQVKGIPIAAPLADAAPCAPDAPPAQPAQPAQLAAAGTEAAAPAPQGQARPWRWRGAALVLACTLLLCAMAWQLT